MSVDRSVEIRLVTKLDYFSELLQLLTRNIYSFNDDGTVTSLHEADIDDFDFMQFSSFQVAKDVLNKREDNGLDNHVVIWDKSLDDSLLVRSTRLHNDYKGYKNQYNIVFIIGHGRRIEGADRYTDFSKYLNKLMPILITKDIYVCEINCRDLDC